MPRRNTGARRTRASASGVQRTVVWSPGPTGRRRARSRLAAPGRPRQHQRRDDREGAEGPRPGLHGTADARGRPRSRPRGTPGDPRHLDARIRDQDGQERARSPVATAPSGRTRPLLTRSQGKITTNRAPATNQAVPPALHAAGPEPPAGQGQAARASRPRRRPLGPGGLTVPRRPTAIAGSAVAGCRRPPGSAA